jgi:uncharacterized membrane protein
MRERLVDWLASLPEPLAVLIAAMLPVLELRGAIPMARLLDLDPATAYLAAVLGNLIPVPFILWGLGPVTEWAEGHWGWFHRFLQRLFSWSRRRNAPRFERLRDLALVAFVAIPLPITGAWSGSLAAFVFGVKPTRALGLIGAGVAIAGVVVLVVTYGVGWWIASAG